MKVSQNQIKTLIVDTVTMLCRNGLVFSSAVRVQGLLGITIDDSEVVLVAMDEMVRCGAGDPSTTSAESGDFNNRPSKKVPCKDGFRNSSSLGNASSTNSAFSSDFQNTHGFKTEPVLQSSGDYISGDASSTFESLKNNGQRRVRRRPVVQQCGPAEEGDERYFGQRATMTSKSDDTIFIESDPSDSENVKCENDCEENQPTEYFDSGNQPVAGPSSLYYPTANTTSRLLPDKMDPDGGQPYINEAEYSIEGEAQLSDPDFVPESDFEPKHFRFGAGFGASGAAKKFRKPVQHFGGLGVSSWRRKQMHQRKPMQRCGRNSIISTPRVGTDEQMIDEQFDEKTGFLSDWNAASERNTSETFSCKLCSARFKHRASLWNHQVNVHKRPKRSSSRFLSDWNAASERHNSESFSCKLCSAKFKHRPSLWKHQVNVHGRPKMSEVNLMI